MTSSSEVTTATFSPRQVPVLAFPVRDWLPYLAATAVVRAAGAPEISTFCSADPDEEEPDKADRDDDEGEDDDVVVSSPSSVLLVQAARLSARAAAAVRAKGCLTPPP